MHLAHNSTKSHPIADLRVEFNAHVNDSKNLSNRKALKAVDPMNIVKLLFTFRLIQVETVVNLCELTQDIRSSYQGIIAVFEPILPKIVVCP